MTDLAFISKSDLEILKALTLANDISKSHSLNSLQTSNDIQASISPDVSVSDSTDSQVTASLSSAVEDVSAYSTFKFDSEYETVGSDVKCVNVMCDLFIEENRNLEMQICSLIKDVSPITQNILSTNHLCEVLEQINNTTDHIVLICDKMYRIQQVLQEKPCERTLKVNPSCQMAVLKFFTIANKLMEKLQQQYEKMDNYQNKNATEMETYHKELQSKLHDKILELAKRIDIISEFRDRILPTSTQNSVSTSKLDMLLS